MIGFANHWSWGSTSYETQKLLMNNVGDRVLASTATESPMFRQVVTVDDATGELIVKVVNAQPAPAPTTVELGREVAPAARVTRSQGDPAVVNTPDSQPIRPAEATFDCAAATFTCTFPPNSVTFLRIRPTQP
ncbi:hypothetical protein E1202_13630 [Saccharopolyspora karakumensis]|uniref:Alpha-L-arabinofuranosidase C-terminal domain-containing protein n=1 Tax=Saccharopolyspora karakumensis TaxID=2530386 RepID=A0A4R5BTJ0_9PSEU|nr:alpha-L-arabinofuranosidase C-terminal domain-containing protein [Saccharopolyspora karakumensis]TDD88610.1 hypothetical protein E1202_13630 [Saccharopolyspora karakumensis]